MKNIAPALCLLLIVAGGCNKNNDDNTPAKSKTDYLTASPWKATSLRVVRINNQDTSINVPIDTCATDNRVTFSTNHIETLDEGATKCNATDPQQTLYTWSFQNNETRLHAVSNTNVNDTISGDLIQLDNNTLKLGLEGTVNADIYRTEFTYSH